MRKDFVAKNLFPSSVSNCLKRFKRYISGSRSIVLMRGQETKYSSPCAGLAILPYHPGEESKEPKRSRVVRSQHRIQRISSMQRPFAKTFLATTVLGFAILQVAAAGAAELPAFEVSSFPATPLQVAVMGGRGVQEQAAAPALTRNNMPASPHQLGVLTPRRSTTASATSGTTVGTARN
jgi:hypothetical protein